MRTARGIAELRRQTLPSRRLRTSVGTGLRFGEVSALWVSDVDLGHRTIRINKAWKRNGENDTTDTPAGSRSG